MAFDVGRGRMVLFGGRDGSTYHGDTWEYDGADWVLATPTASPPARANAGMTYDADRGVVVLFGGFTSWDRQRDTWVLRDDEWLPLVTPLLPTARADAAMSYDVGRQQVVLFGGYSNLQDTWQLGFASALPLEDCASVGDEDGDGLADCADPDCHTAAHCQPGESCHNGIDDDGDGLVDCADPGCGGLPCGAGLTCSGGACQ